MNWAKRRDLIKLVLIGLWLLFTVAFAIWWFLFSVDHISQLAQLQPDRVAHWERQKRMVFWEGSTWLVLLVLGGGALIGLVQREKLRARRIREFFASFSHEVKTSLASLRVQAEALKDDLGSQSSPILDRLVGDTVRLQLQLENSLFLASQDNLQLYFEPLDLEPLVERTREQWPNLDIQLKGKVTVFGDARALRTIFSNLVQNSHVHGKAKVIVIEAADEENNVRITVTDDGRGFDGPFVKLGELFHRPTSSSGSGLGLHITKLLLARMGGRLRFEESAKGFRTVMTLPGARE